jgi:alkanesulfonate monooxygenase SsuD/methylene tetrahydromethanopterin reductase-like flavin-dependent oxidoreductase (luciferase family)
VPVSRLPLAFGVDLGRAHPATWKDLTQAAEELGYESVWLPEHLVMPVSVSSMPGGDPRHRGVNTRTPMFDVFAMLGWLAAHTTTLRLGTNVYNIGLRHPFVTARGLATLDLVSGGRAELGIGASWLPEEWEAVGLDFASRGSRVDESIEICRRLWSLPTTDFKGDHFHFREVIFEPKPAQQRPRI